jgi:hypothetical protein
MVKEYSASKTKYETARTVNYMAITSKLYCEFTYVARIIISYNHTSILEQNKTNSLSQSPQIQYVKSIAQNKQLQHSEAAYNTRVMISSILLKINT